MVDDEYLIKVYRKSENIEYGHKLTIPEEIRNVHTRVLTKEGYKVWKESLNKYVEFINKELDENVNFLEKQLEEGSSKQFELKMSMSVQTKKKVKEKIKND